MKVWNFDTEQSADSVEYCPFPGYELYCAVGTYQVVQGQEFSRVGRLLLLKTDAGIVKIQQIETSAILDMKWAIIAQKQCLAVVTSIGELIIYEFINGQLLHLKTINNDKVDVLNLSLDILNDRIVISQSDGHVAILDDLMLKSDWEAHSYEAWIAAFDRHNDIIYSGGDDCFLKAWSNQNLVFKKRHDAGVSSISSHSHKPILATGGYDQFIRIWDTRQMKEPISQFDTGGGVWRLKWHPTNHDKILAACMYNGFQIYDINKGLEFSYNQESIAYGADWCRKDDWIGTCSFYNHLFCLWKE